MALEIYTDGGARGNPGPAAAGVVIRDDQGRSILEAGYFLGEATNNVAEYTAMILALEAACKFGAGQVFLFADSELVVKQLTGEYKVRDARLTQLFERVQRLLIKFDSWQIRHIARSQNRRADALVNKTLDAGKDIVEIQLGDAKPQERPAPVAAGEDGVGVAVEPAAPAAGGTEVSGLTPIVAQVIAGPRGHACKAGTYRGQQFVFGETAPANICIYALKAVLDTVLAMRYAAGEQEAAEAVQVRCGRSDCGAVFQIRMAGEPGQEAGGRDGRVQPNT
jgi:ribonuclease HI